MRPPTAAHQVDDDAAPASEWSAPDWTTAQPKRRQTSRQGTTATRVGHEEKVLPPELGLAGWVMGAATKPSR